MENRETREFTTTGGHKLVIKTYASGREYQEIQDVYLKGAKLNLVDEEMKIEGFDFLSETRAKEKTIELLVVSMDGESKDIVKRVYDLPFQETEEIIAELQKVSGKKKTA